MKVLQAPNISLDSGDTVFHKEARAPFLMGLIILKEETDNKQRRKQQEIIKSAIEAILNNTQRQLCGCFNFRFDGANWGQNEKVRQMKLLGKNVSDKGEKLILLKIQMEA